MPADGDQQQLYREHGDAVVMISSHGPADINLVRSSDNLMVR